MTGASGFTGKHVVSKLREIGAVPNALLAPLENLEELDHEIGNSAPDFVIHLAGIANVAYSDNLEFYRVNVLGTTNLLDVLSRRCTGLKQVLIASSANVYGNAENSPIDEDTSTSPLNHYATSKVAMELLSRTWLVRLPIAFTRPFNYTGVGQSEAFLIPKVVGHFVRRESEISLGNLNVTREFNDVRMIAEAYVGLLQNAVIGEIYNLCSGHGHTLHEVLDLLERLTGTQISVKVDQALVRPNELSVLIGNPAKLNRTVSELTQYPLENTLTWMLGL